MWVAFCKWCRMLGRSRFEHQSPNLYTLLGHFGRILWWLTWLNHLDLFGLRCHPKVPSYPSWKLSSTILSNWWTQTPKIQKLDCGSSWDWPWIWQTCEKKGDLRHVLSQSLESTTEFVGCFWEELQIHRAFWFFFRNFPQISILTIILVSLTAHPINGLSSIFQIHVGWVVPVYSPRGINRSDPGIFIQWYPVPPHLGLHKTPGQVVDVLIHNLEWRFRKRYLFKGCEYMGVSENRGTPKTPQNDHF